MNIQELQQKITDITNLLSVYLQEAQALEAKRASIEATNYSLTERETRLNYRQKELFQKEQDVTAQKKYIEENLEKNSKILEGIKKEREFLRIDATAKAQFEKDTAYLEVREKELQEKLIAFEKEKALSKKQEAATSELITILDAREKRIKAREAHLQMLSTA
jgi:hypothetical protein